MWVGPALYERLGVEAAAVINVLFLRAHKKDFFRQAGHRKIVERELDRRGSLMEMDFYTHSQKGFLPTSWTPEDCGKGIGQESLMEMDFYSHTPEKGEESKQS